MCADEQEYDMAMVTVIIINLKLTTRGNQQLYSRQSGDEVPGILAHVAKGESCQILAGRM